MGSILNTIKKIYFKHQKVITTFKKYIEYFDSFLANGYLTLDFDPEIILPLVYAYKYFN